MTKSATRTFGILTSGGDCPGLNAAIRGVAKAAYEKYDMTIIGINDGYRGLIEGDARLLKASDFKGILTRGGTILGTSREKPFKAEGLRDSEAGQNKSEAIIENYKKLNLDCLVVLGGNGTHKTANLLKKEGLSVIGLPKTIDNDIWGTDVTFGFHSAVDIATEAIDRLHSTAHSHNRIMVIELMGHKAGWLALYAGISGGGDVILIPEIPY
ncbi:MAG: 6-phosphofructokinase, partial [Spirochaetaceae bacterium]|nr:6-phosphofructokinase [Spirochaetaceae bacterium]